MNPRFSRAAWMRGLIASLGLFVFANPDAWSATMTWDANGTTAGVTDGSANWTTSSNQWWNGTSTGTWVNGNDAVIGAGNGAAGTITITGTMTVANLTLNAPGSGTYTINAANNQGAISLTSGLTANNSTLFNAPLLLGAANSWTINTGATLTLAGGVTGNGNTLAIGGAGNLTLQSSSMILNGASAYSGSTTLRGNTGTLTLNGAGTLANTAALSISGMTFVSGSTGDAVTNSRINSAAPLTLGGNYGSGTFTLTKPSAGTSTQTFANLNLGTGVNVINNTAVAGAVIFTGASGAGYSRTPGGFINFGVNTVSFTNAPVDATGLSVTNSGVAANDILLGAVINNADFVSAVSGTIKAPTYINDVFASGSNTNIASAILTAIGDTQSLRFGRNATLTLSGTSTITSGGIIPTGGDSIITGGALRSGSGGNLWINGIGGSNLTINSPIVDNNGSGLEKFGANTLTLGGSNSFTGPVALGGGIVLLNHANALGEGSANMTVAASTVLKSGTTGIVTNRNLVLVPTSSLTVDTNGFESTTFNGSISASNSNYQTSFIKSGNGTLYFTGSTVGTPTLNVNVNGGTLDVSGTLVSGMGSNLDGALGAAPVLEVHGNALVSLAGDFNILQTAGTGTNALRYMTVNISDNAQVITAGRMFVGHASNSYTVVNQNGGLFGSTVNGYFLNGVGTSGSNATAIHNLNGGLLRLGNNGVLATNAFLNLNGGTIQTSGNTNASITLSSTNNQAATVGGVAGKLVVLANSGTFDVLNTHTLTVSAPITHDSNLGASADGGISKVSTGKLVLTATNTYTGPTTLNSGILNAGVAETVGVGGALGYGGNIVFNSGTLQFSTASAGADYSTRFKNSTGAIILDPNAQSVALAGVVDSSNTGGLTINDSNATKGTVTLSAANTFSGNTTVTSGTLKLTNSLALQNSVLTTGSTGLVIDPSVAGSLSLGGLSGSVAFAMKDSANGTVNLTLGGGNSTASYSGILSGSGNLTKVGTGTQSLTNTASTYTGKTIVNGGILSIANSDMALGTAPASPVADQLTLSSGTLQFTGNTALVANRGVTLIGLGTFDTQANSPTINGIIAGSGTLAKMGSGLLTIGTANSYTGGTVVNGGLIAITSGSNSLGAGTSGNVSLNGGGIQATFASQVFASWKIDVGAGGGTLKNMNAKWLLNPNTLTGTGTLTLSGLSTSVIQFSGTQAFSGKWVVDSVILASPEYIGSRPGDDAFTLQNGAALNLIGGSTFLPGITVASGTQRLMINGNAAASGTLASKITGPGVVRFEPSKYGSSPLNLVLTNPANDWSGGVQIYQNGGSNDRSALALGADEVIPNGVGKGNVFISGTYGYLEMNGHTETINGLTGGAANSLVDNKAAGTASLIVGDADTTTAFIGRIDNTGGALSLGKIGTGSFTLSGNNGFTGSTTVTAGKLVVSGSLNGTTSVSVANAAELNVNGLVNTAAAISVAGKLSGSGTMGAVSVSSGGVLAPGNSPGVITLASLTGTTGATLSIELGKTTTGVAPVAGSDYDQVITDSVILDDMTLSLVGTSGLANVEGGDLFFLIINNGTEAVSGTFAGLSQNQNFFFNGQEYRITYTGNYATSAMSGGNDVALYAVPEPTTWVFLLSGFGMLMSIQRLRLNRVGTRS